jgi:hypothetical protein
MQPVTLSAEILGQFVPSDFVAYCVHAAMFKEDLELLVKGQDVLEEFHTKVLKHVRSKQQPQRGQARKR